MIFTWPCEKEYKNVGAPRAPSSEVEGRLAKMIDELAEWGYPTGKTEIKLMVKEHFGQK